MVFSLFLVWFLCRSKWKRIAHTLFLKVSATISTCVDRYLELLFHVVFCSSLMFLIVLEGVCSVLHKIFNACLRVKRSLWRGTLVVVVCRCVPDDNCNRSAFLAIAPGVRFNSFAKTLKLVTSFFYSSISLASSARVQ